MEINQKLKICIVTQQLGKVLSGPGVHTRNLVEHLIRDGHDVVVVSLKEQEPEAHPRFRFIGVDRPAFANNQARWLALSRSFSKVIHNLEKEETFDLIHFTDVRDAFFCKTRTPRIGNINDTYSAEIQPLKYYLRNYYDGLERWSYYQMTHIFERRYLPGLAAVIANSQYTARMIRSSYPEVSSKTFMIYKSIEASHFREVLNTRQNSREKSKSQILLVGSNLQRKGIRYLIQAAPEIISEFPQIQFMVAGGDPAIPRLMKLSRQVCGGDYFQFFGNQSRERINELYTGALIFTLPALTEALGIVLLEAMASGVPVIGTNVGGIPEIINHGVNGILVSPGNASALAQALILFIKDETLQSGFVEAGLRTVGGFSVQKMMAGTYDVYHHVLEG